MNPQDYLSARRISALIGLLVATTCVGCGDDGSVPTRATCYQGDNESCAGDDGCVGMRTCDNRGNWGNCACSVPTKSLLGGACSDDSACPGGATCLLPFSTEWLGGGPPVGLCVADCTEDDAICAEYENAICLSADRSDSGEGTRALCMPECDPNVGTKAAQACSAVPSSACEPLGPANAGFCRPFCRFDGDCPTGHCDHQVGACVAEATPPPPQAFGTSCDPATPNCDGVCLQLGADASICSNRCVYGTTSECAIEGATPIAGVCAYPAGPAIPGDLGYCSPLCNCNDDCVASGFVCQAFSTSSIQTTLEHVGLCMPALDSAGATHSGVTCKTP